MITQVRQVASPLSVRHWCELLQVNRACYYQAQPQADQPDPNVAVRDASEHLVLEFPG